MGRFVWDAGKNKAIPLSEISIEPEQGETFAPAVPEESTDYNDMNDEALAALATERHIDTTGKTRRQVINALRKADEQG